MIITLLRSGAPARGAIANRHFTDMRQRVVLHDRGGAFSAPAVTTVVLTYCNWEWVIGKSRYSETFEALSEGLQGALWQLGGVPR